MMAAILYTLLLSVSQLAFAQESSLIQRNFKNGLAEFETYRQEMAETVSHPRHLPILLHHGRVTDHAVLYIHGLYESPNYSKGIINYFHNSGFNVLAPLLSGHWQKKPELLENTSYHEWISDLNRSIKIAEKLGKKIILSGYSTGGLLAIRGALENPDLVAGIIVWAPAIFLTQGRYWSIQYASLFHKTLNDELKLKPDGYDVAHYTPKAGQEVIELIQDTFSKFAQENSITASRKRADAAKKISAPLLLIISEEDDTADPNAAKAFYRSIRAKKDILAFQEGSDIKHGNITKNKSDVFIGWEDRYNFQFDPMCKKMDEFLLNNNFLP